MCENAPVKVRAISEIRISKFRRRLLSWFAKRKRDLPWRRTQDPYAIWISEIMLQQTRVAAVIPYYERFLMKFPTMHSLARARPETVLGLWAGLRLLQPRQKFASGRKGNYFPARRQFPARHGIRARTAGNRALYGSGRFEHRLTKATSGCAGWKRGARACATGGRARRFTLPRDLAAARKLGANFARLQDSRRLEPVHDGTRSNSVHSEISLRWPRMSGLHAWCWARKLGIAGELPSPRKKRATVQVIMAAAVLLDPRGRTLLVRQSGSDGALFSRMWQFPAVETAADAVCDLARYLRKNFKIVVNGNLKPAGTARHTVTFREIRLLPFVIRVRRLPRLEGARTEALGSLGKLPVSNATRKIAQAALADSATLHLPLGA